MAYKKEYAMYKGDKFIAIGTKQELAKIKNVSIKTIEHFCTPHYKKRVKNNGIIMIKLDD